MTALSLVLVLCAAGVHASWNFLAKRAGEGGPPFVWLFGLLSTVLYLPVMVGVVVWTRPDIGADELLFLFGSGTLHLVYFTVLQRGYREGDLSVVYPLARGTGPLLSSSAAIAFLDERPSAQAIAGGALICLGVFVLAAASGDRLASRVPIGVAYGLVTGGIIATYTLWDKHAVATLAIPPLILDWSANFVRTLLLTPVALARRRDMREIWNRHRREVIGVAVLAPAAYILVLSALAVTAVSYVAPAREVSILIGTFLGVRVLKEGAVGVRMIGAGLMIGGLAALATG